jgi:hypothetical protein
MDLDPLVKAVSYTEGLCSIWELALFRLLRKILLNKFEGRTTLLYNISKDLGEIG